jgi:hypothetical protein
MSNVKWSDRCQVAMERDQDETGQEKMLGRRTQSTRMEVAR